MKQYEYKIEYVAFKGEGSKEGQLLDALNDFGREGWRMNRMFADFSLKTFTSWKGGINLMLERETSVQS